MGSVLSRIRRKPPPAKAEARRSRREQRHSDADSVGEMRAAIAALGGWHEARVNSWTPRTSARERRRRVPLTDEPDESATLTANRAAIENGRENPRPPRDRRPHVSSSDADSELLANVRTAWRRLRQSGDERWLQSGDSWLQRWRSARAGGLPTASDRRESPLFIGLEAPKHPREASGYVADIDSAIRIPRCASPEVMEEIRESSSVWPGTSTSWSGGSMAGSGAMVGAAGDVEKLASGQEVHDSRKREGMEIERRGGDPEEARHREAKRDARKRFEGTKDRWRAVRKHASLDL